MVVVWVEAHGDYSNAFYSQHPTLIYKSKEDASK